MRPDISVHTQISKFTPAAVCPLAKRGQLSLTNYLVRQSEINLCIYTVINIISITCMIGIIHYGDIVVLTNDDKYV